MVSEILRNIMPGHGYWRTAPFAELAELYAARFLRTVSQSMVGVFVAVFMYQKGYSLVDIMMIIGGYYLLRAVASFASAYYVAWVGPKQATLVSNVLAVPALVSLTMVDQATVVAVLAFFFFQAISLSLYTIASDMQFSSLKSDHHAGKEIGWLHIVERAATGVAPMLGGFIAFVFGPEFTMWVAAILSIAAALPLFMTPEKIHRQQRIIFRGLPWRMIRRQLVSSSLLGADQLVSGATWSIFVAIAVFGTADNSVYAKLGVVFSISLIVSIVVSRVYGIVIDRRRSRELLISGIVMNAIVHASRPFINTPLGVAMINGTNEIGTSAYHMPYFRGVYDEADNLPGYRVVYISVMMITFCLGAAVLSFITAGAIVLLGPLPGLSASFFAMAVLTLGVYWHGFDALQRRS